MNLKSLTNSPKKKGGFDAGACKGFAFVKFSSNDQARTFLNAYGEFVSFIMLTCTSYMIAFLLHCQ